MPGPTPLSEEQVAQCKADIISSYQNYKCLAPDSPVNLAEVFTNLTVGPPRNIPNEPLLKYNDLFVGANNGESGERVMVLGNSGAGKTAVCAKIVRDWMNGDGFDQFTMVLLVHQLIQNVTIGEIAKALLSDTNPVTVDQLNVYITENPDKVLIVCDGLDKFIDVIWQSHDWQLSEDNSQSSDSESIEDVSQASHDSESSEDDCLISSILLSDQPEDCSVLVTCNPSNLHVNLNGFFDRKYWVGGLRNENLSECIQNYFRDDKSQLANRLIQAIEESDVLTESLNLARFTWTPSFVRKLCLMWAEIDENERENVRCVQTFSWLFTKVCTFLKEHNVQSKTGNSVVAQNEHLMEFSQVCYEKLLDNPQNRTFKEQDFEDCQEGMNTALEIGLLTKENGVITWEKVGTKSQTNTNCPVSFTHKLFQDSLAGEYFASLYSNNI